MNFLDVKLTPFWLCYRRFVLSQQLYPIIFYECRKSIGNALSIVLSRHSLSVTETKKLVMMVGSRIWICNLLNFSSTSPWSLDYTGFLRIHFYINLSTGTHVRNPDRTFFHGEFNRENLKSGLYVLRDVIPHDLRQR